MRIMIVTISALFVAACGSALETADAAPFTANWEGCETYRDASVCAGIAMAQNGARVCAVRQDFATNAYYTHRLMGTADGDSVHFDQICGDPGSETDSFCPDQVPEGAGKIGWASYDLSLHLCDGNLFSASVDCATAEADAGIPRATQNHLPLTPEDSEWLTACME